MSVVLGLDLGGKLGWCVLDGAELRAASVQRLGVKSGPRGGLVEVPGLRAHDLRSFLRALLEQHVPNVLAFERVRRHAGTDAAHALGALRLTRLVTLERDDRWHLTLAGCLRARALVEQTREQQALTARRHRDGLRPPEEVEQARRRYLRRRLFRGLRRLREGA